MKMNNQDTLKIAEIKVDLLDPPYTFKLYQYALPKTQSALEIVKKYNPAASQLLPMEELIQEMGTHPTELNKLRDDLKQFAKVLNEIARK